MAITLLQLQAMTALIASTAAMNGWELAKHVSLRGGYYPSALMHSLERQGMVTSELEDFNPSGRNARRFYSPTPTGIAETKQALSVLGMAT